MLAKICSGSTFGVEGYLVDVEVDLSQGLPVFDIVGLPDSAVKESKERVRTAITNSGYSFPVKRITVNLAPADIKKEGPSFDLPIAMGILTCIDVLSHEEVKDIFFTGELSLDGSIRSTSGILSLVHNAKLNNVKKCVIPYENYKEATLIEGIEVIPAKNLNDLIEILKSKEKFVLPENEIETETEETTFYLDFSDVKGQENLKRAFTVAAAGNHNILMVGPPGSGKTMMAKRVPSIMPNLNVDQQIEVTKIYSVSNLLINKGKLVETRPFRAPHHTISYSALTGGGRIPKPGEISLAHQGILFLDELPEFHKNVLEVLRQPLEDGYVSISRANGSLTFPSRFMLIASMNPCPCGYYGSDNNCKCTEREIAKYLGKISGPLLDRIDIQVEVTAVKYNELEVGNQEYQTSSEEIKRKVMKAVEVQKNRYKDFDFEYNSELTPKLIEKYCVIKDEDKKMLERAFEVMNLSARAYYKILKVARTIADLEECEDINMMHLSEALQYRNLDRKYWQ